MGLHSEFVCAAKEIGIKTVFTTHDYYGICPKVTLFRNGMTCDDDCNCCECVLCNDTGLSINKIFMIQSPLYRILKDSSLVKILRKRHRSRDLRKEVSSGFIPNDSDSDYRKLRAYYVDILENIDLIHFNSSISKIIYARYVNIKNSAIISITHKDICNHISDRTNRWEKTFRMLYLAPTKPYKGYSLLIAALEQLHDEKLFDFTLDVYYPVENKPSYVTVNEAYKPKELASVFENADVLIAPSVWYETFGFTVLEALSYGVPVIVSDNVGAKDIIGDCGIVFRAGSISELKEAIMLMQKKLKNNQLSICASNMKIKDIHTHSREILELYTR